MLTFMERPPASLGSSGNDYMLLEISSFDQPVASGKSVKYKKTQSLGCRDSWLIEALVVVVLLDDCGCSPFISSARAGPEIVQMIRIYSLERTSNKSNWLNSTSNPSLAPRSYRRFY